MRRRIVPVLALVILAPVCGEVLSGSTPIAMFLNPISLLFEVGLYGLGAILVRELVRSRGLGWTNLLLLGAAYGVLEEGLVVTSWMNPYWPDAISLGDRGRLFDINWIWATGLTVFHAVESIAVPIVLVEALFPERAADAWLSDQARRRVATLLGIVCAVELLLFGFVQFREQAYSPPGSYLLALVIAAAFVRLGLRRRDASRLPAIPTTAPTAWRLRAFAFVATVAFFFGLWALPNIVPIGIVPIGFITGLVWLASTRIRRWARDPVWGATQRLALASGVTAFFLVLAPLLEYGVHPAGRNTAGMTSFAMLMGLGLLWLARRAVSRPRVSASVTA